MDDERAGDGAGGQTTAPPREREVNRIGMRFRFFLALVLEAAIRVLPLPPRLVLILHACRGVRFEERSSVFIRPLVKLGSQFCDQISIGRNVFLDVGAIISPETYIPVQAPPTALQRRIVIEDGVYVGTGAVVMAGVTLREGAVVDAGSVVYEDVEPHCLVRGNPARIVERLEPVSRSSSAIPDEVARGIGTSGAYDENGLSLQAFPYEQRFLVKLLREPASVLRSLVMHLIITLPIPPRVATAIYAWMGVRFKNRRSSGVAMPTMLDVNNPGDIEVGECSHISSYCMISSHFFDPRLPGFCYRKAKVTIGDHVFVGMGVITGTSVSIGSHSIISANSVLFRDVREKLGVLGNPARAFTRVPAYERDYESTVDRDKRFIDDTGKSERIYHFEHRVSVVLGEDPRRVLNFALEAFAAFPPFPSWVRAMIYRFWGVRIRDPWSLKLGYLVYLERLVPGHVTIGRNVRMGDRVRILAHYPEVQVNGCYYRTGHVVIEDDVVLGANAVVASNIRIGRGAVVMPGTLIIEDVAPHTIVGGVPSEIIGTRDLGCADGGIAPDL